MKVVPKNFSLPNVPQNWNSLNIFFECFVSRKIKSFFAKDNSFSRKRKVYFAMKKSSSGAGVWGG